MVVGQVRRFSSVLALLALAALAMTGVSAAAPAGQLSGAVPGRQATYVNPVSKTFADTFADPSIIRGNDGWWYAYATSDPLRAGQTRQQEIPISRSRDLVTWHYVGQVFSGSTLPSWAEPDTGLWAPDIRYVDGQYRLYYVVTDTTRYPGSADNAIGMATAPTPAGPWTDSGSPVVAPRPGEGGAAAGDFLWTFDPDVVTDADGSQWIYYGSYYGGIFVAPLSADGTRVSGAATQVAIDNKFEGAYVVHRDGWWYLFASTANCCAGPTTGYSVEVGRSRSVTGPFRDKQGTSLLASRTGGTPTLYQNGDRWVGTGHNAIVTDLAGQDWIVYHAIDRHRPYLTGTSGVNRRAMLIDRLDWIDGWPAVRGGRGPSAGHVPAPVTSGAQSLVTSAAVGADWTDTGLRGSQDSQSGSDLTSTGPATLRTRSTVAGPVRVQALVRSSGAALGLRTTGPEPVTLTVQPRTRAVRLEAEGPGQGVAAGTVLPPAVSAGTWHVLTLTVQGRTAHAQISDANQGDPLVDLTVRLPAAPGRSGAEVFAVGRGVTIDDVSALPAATPVTRLYVPAVQHRLDQAASDDFSGGRLGAGWSWVRRDPAAHVTGGRLVWPTEDADLSGAGSDAGVLLRRPGSGPWTIETKVTTDFGVNAVRNYVQAGLVAYVNDDLFARLDTVAIWDTRQIEFGHEIPYAGGTSYGGTIVGPPARTTWLRISHTVDRRTGEHDLRAWSSRDGRHWVEGGVWTLPAGSHIRVGLVSQGGAPALARFDWFRLYR